MCQRKTDNQFAFFDVVPQLKSILNRYYYEMVDYVAATTSARQNEFLFGDCITANRYKNLGENPDNNGIFWLNLIVSTDGAPVLQQQVLNHCFFATNRTHYHQF